MLTTQTLVLLFKVDPTIAAQQDAIENARWTSFRDLLRSNTHDDVAERMRKPKGAERHPFVVECVAQGVMSEKSAQNRLSEMRGIVKAYDYGMPLDVPTGWKSAVALADQTREAEKGRQEQRAEAAERAEIRQTIVGQVGKGTTVEELETLVDRAHADLLADKGWVSAEKRIAKALTTFRDEFGPDAFASLLRDFGFVPASATSTVLDAAPFCAVLDAAPFLGETAKA